MKTKCNMSFLLCAASLRNKLKIVALAIKSQHCYWTKGPKTNGAEPSSPKIEAFEKTLFFAIYFLAKL